MNNLTNIHRTLINFQSLLISIIFRLSSLYFTLILIAFSSCTSPTDVPANRKITDDNQLNKKQNNNTNPLSVNIKELIFDEVPYQGSKPNSFTIFNNSDEPQIISKIYSERYREYFRLYSPSIPFTLGPKSSDSSAKQVIIVFYGNKLGETFDKLKINEHPDLTINLKGFVPTIDISDCDFGFIPNNTSKNKSIILINYGTSVANIRGYQLIDQDSAFMIQSSTPMYIKPNEQIYFFIKFTPKEAKPYSAKIEFNIEAPGYIDNDAILSGAGIRN